MNPVLDDQISMRNRKREKKIYLKNDKFLSTASIIS